VPGNLDAGFLVFTIGQALILSTATMDLTAGARGNAGRMDRDAREGRRRPSCPA
jgi:hypothetical protein